MAPAVANCPMVVLLGPESNVVWNRLPPDVRRIARTVELASEEISTQAVIESLREGIADLNEIVLIGLSGPSDGGAQLRQAVRAATFDPVMGRKSVRVNLVFLAESPLEARRWTQFASETGWSVFIFQQHWREHSRDRWTALPPFCDFVTAMLCTEPSRFRDRKLTSFSCAREQAGVYAAGVERFELETAEDLVDQILMAEIASHFVPCWSGELRKALERRVRFSVDRVFRANASPSTLVEEFAAPLLLEAAARSVTLDQMAEELRPIEARCASVTASMVRDLRLEVISIAAVQHPAATEVEPPVAEAAKQAVLTMFAEYPFLPLRQFAKRTRPAGLGHALDMVFEEARRLVARSVQDGQLVRFEAALEPVAPYPRLDPRTRKSIESALGIADSESVSYHLHVPRDYVRDERNEILRLPGRALFTCLARIGGGV